MATQGTFFGAALKNSRTGILAIAAFGFLPALQILSRGKTEIPIVSHDDGRIEKQANRVRKAVWKAL